MEIRLPFLFLSVSHLPHPVSNQRSLWKQGSTIIPAFSEKVGRLNFTATICLVYKPRLLYRTFISCTPNPLTIGYKSFSWCPSLSIFTFQTVLNPFPPPQHWGPRSFPKAVTLSDIRIGPGHPGLHPNYPQPPLPNSIFRYYLENKIWPKVPLYWCPPLPSLYPCYSFSLRWIHSTPDTDESHKHSVGEATEIRSQRICPVPRLSTGLEAGLVVPMLGSRADKCSTMGTGRKVMIWGTGWSPCCKYSYLANFKLLTACHLMWVGKNCAVGKHCVAFPPDRYSR